MGTHWAAGLLIKGVKHRVGEKGKNCFSKSRFGLASMSM